MQNSFGGGRSGILPRVKCSAVNSASSSGVNCSKGVYLLGSTCGLITLPKRPTVPAWPMGAPNMLPPGAELLAPKTLAPVETAWLAEVEEGAAGVNGDGEAVVGCGVDTAAPKMDWLGAG